MTTYYAIGSSITSGASTEAGYCFPKMLAKELNVDLVNLGVPGSTVGTKYHPSSSIWEPDKTLGAILKATKSLANTTFNKGDFVTLECINDFRVSIELDDFIDSYRELLTVLQNNKSFVDNNVKLYILTPHQFNVASGRPSYNDKNLYNLFLEDYTTFMINMGRNYKFTKIVDMSNAFPPTSEYVYDGVHLSVKAKQEYIRILKSVIQSITPNQNKTIAYIPLDDRPCNVERIELAAKAMGIEILFPPRDAYRTCLDGQPLNSNNTQVGNPEKILSWFEGLDSNRIDAFLVSLDQLYSGGLVGSRSLQHTNPFNVSKEMNRLERLMNKINNKPVYFQDSVLRLTTTVGFQGCEMDVYNKIYKYASVERFPHRVKPGVDIEETFADIIGSYDYDHGYKYIDYKYEYGLTDKEHEGYMNARIRKMNLMNETRKYLQNASNVSYYAYGIDDSNNKKTIQENEINFIKDVVVKGNESKCKIYGGIDETAMCLLSRIATDFYCYSKPRVKVRYYGGAENNVAEGWNYLTLRQVVEGHIDMAGGVAVPESSTNPTDLELLILTKPVNGKDMHMNGNDLHWQANYNNSKHVLTAIIDASEYKNKGADFQKRLFGEYGNPMELSRFLSYSNWNTVSNAAGMAIGHAIGRYSYLITDHSKDHKRRALEHQAKLLFTEYCKDICYQIDARSVVDQGIINACNNSNAVNNFYKYGMDQNGSDSNYKTKALRDACYSGMTKGVLNVNKLANLFLSNAFIYESYKSVNSYQLTQLNWVNYPYENGRDWFALSFPWHRTFECNFPLNVSFK